MAQQIRKRTFPNTLAALEEFNDSAEKRLAAWGKVETATDLYSAQNADDAATRKVQEAFYMDTQDINNREDCMRIDIAFVRRIAMG